MISLFHKENINATESIIKLLFEGKDLLERTKSKTMSQKMANFAKRDKNLYILHRDKLSEHINVVPELRNEIKYFDRIIEDYERIEHCLERQSSNYDLYIRDIYETLQVLAEYYEKVDK